MMRKMTTKRSDYGRLFNTRTIGESEYDYYIDDDTKEVMIMKDGRPEFDESIHITKLLNKYVKVLADKGAL